MKIYSCYTPSHKELFDNYFVGSLPSTLDSIPYFLDIQGRGDFLSVDFLEAIRRKMRLVIDSVEENLGSVIIWSDVDIVFMRDPTPSIQDIFANDQAVEIAFQREGKKTKDVNAGFIAMRCTERVKAFYEQVIDQMVANPHWNEQAAINHLLSGDCPVTWDYLPGTFYARSHGWPPPRNLVLYHANATRGADGVGQKKSQFRELAFIGRYGRPARLWSCVTKVPGKVSRTVSGIAAAASAGIRSEARDP